MCFKILKFPSGKRKSLYALLISLSIPIIPITGSGSPEEYIPDISVFLKIGRNVEPDYGRVADNVFFISTMSGTDQVYRLDESGWPYQLTAFENGVDWFKVSYDGNQAIAGASEGGSEKTQLYLVDSQSGLITPITANNDIIYGSIFWRRDGDGFYYRSNKENKKDFKIYYHDLKGGTEFKIFDMAGNNAPGDLSADGKLMAIYHMRSNINSDLYLLDTENGEYRQLTDGGDNVRYNYPSISADNKTMYVICDDNPDGIMRRAKIDIDSGKITFLEPYSKTTVEVLDFSDNRRFMVWLENDEGYSKMHLLDMAQNQPLPVPELRGRIEDPRLLDDGRLLFTFDNPTKTSDIWMWDWRSSELKRLTFATYAGINPEIFKEPQLIKYESFDGLEIPAFLYLPPDYDGRPVPFIVRIHGGPAEQFRPYFVRNFQYFLLNGFGLLVPNIRGSLGYGKEYANLDNYKNRPNAIKDVGAGVDFLIKNGYARIGEIGIMGPSYGGFMTLASIIEYPDLFSAAIDRTGISDFVTYLQNTGEYRKELRETEYGPLSDTAFLKSISPLGKANLIKTPLLVVHGENDSRVPISEARQLIEAIRANGGAVDSLIFPDEGHLISKQSNRIALYRKVVEFFDKYLKKSK